MKHQKNNKHVVITGGSKGLGFEFAKLFAKEQYDLILVARGKDELTRAAKQLEENNNISCHTFAYDLSVMAEIDKFYKEVKEKRLEVSILIKIGRAHV